MYGTFLQHLPKSLDLYGKEGALFSHKSQRRLSPLNQYKDANVKLLIEISVIVNLYVEFDMSLRDIFMNTHDKCVCLFVSAHGKNKHRTKKYMLTFLYTHGM